MIIGHVDAVLRRVELLSDALRSKIGPLGPGLRLDRRLLSLVESRCTDDFLGPQRALALQVGARLGGSGAGGNRLRFALSSRQFQP